MLCLDCFTIIIIFYKLLYLNIQAIGLSGRPYPVLAWVLTTQDVMTIRPHLKMLAGDYICYAYLAHDRGVDPHCRMCKSLSSHPAPAEDLVHLLTRCRATADTRDRVLPELFNTVSKYIPSNALLTSTAHHHLTQFILDCSSLNLPANIRVNPNRPGFNDIARQCSTTINAIHNHRTRLVKAMCLL